MEKLEYLSHNVTTLGMDDPRNRFKFWLVKGFPYATAHGRPPTPTHIYLTN
jgi:hypothetical protein